MNFGSIGAASLRALGLRDSPPKHAEKSADGGATPAGDAPKPSPAAADEAARRRRLDANASAGGAEDGAARVHLDPDDPVRIAAHGDGLSSANYSLKPRRTGSHEGSRDARIAELQLRRGGLKAAHDPADSAQVNRERTRIDGELEDEVALNAVAEVQHVVGGDHSVVSLLDNAAKVVAKRDEELPGQAAHDSRSGAIEVSGDALDDARASVKRLQDDGILDDRGRIVAGRERDLDGHDAGNDLIKLGSLLGVHEAVHAKQSPAGGGKHAEPSGPLDWVAERARIGREEYEAYQHQELNDVRLGGSLEVQLTVDYAGKPLPREEAIDNIVALEQGVALPHGPDKGWVRKPSRSEQVAGGVPGGEPGPAQALPDGDQQPGWKRPGWKRPGWKRPGWKRPGFTTD